VWAASAAVLPFAHGYSPESNNQNDRSATPRCSYRGALSLCLHIGVCASRSKRAKDSAPTAAGREIAEALIFQARNAFSMLRGELAELAVPMHRAPGENQAGPAIARFGDDHHRALRSANFESRIPQTEAMIGAGKRGPPQRRRIQATLAARGTNPSPGYPGLTRELRWRASTRSRGIVKWP
jgi:hypothetical protein